MTPTSEFPRDVALSLTEHAAPRIHEFPQTWNRKRLLNDRLPLELRQFIALHIESLAQLEALLLMRRERGRAMKLGELARTLYISDDMCRGMLIDLARRGFIEGDTNGESFRYANTEETIEGLISQLEKFYQDRRVAVITEIYSNPSKKVQTFADAFRLRKGDSP